MTVRVAHLKVSTIPDSDDTSLVRPSDWNEDHVVEGLGTAAEANSSDLLSRANHTGTQLAATISDFSTAADARISAAIGVTVQAYDADLAAWAGVNPSSYSTTAQIAAAYQPLDADLTAIAALAVTDNNFIVGNGTTWVAESGATARTSMGLGTGNSPQFTAIELGNASDTTLSRGAAGFMAVEGKRVPSPASQATGDLLYRGSTEWERLAKGTALQVLRQNSALTAPEWANAREVLAGNRTYYVRTNGSDSNDGLADTAGGAFLTYQKALDVVATLDLAGFTVTVQVADGTYTGAASMTKPAIGGPVIVQGNSGTPANVILSTTSANAFSASGAGVTVTVKDMKVQTTTAGYGLSADLGASITFANMNFGACPSGHIVAQNGARLICNNGAFTISGAAPGFVSLYTGAGASIRGNSVTVSGTPAFSFAFLYATLLSNIYIDGNTWTGSATGTRYIIDGNSVVNTSGAGATHLPGNAAGSASTGAVYL